MTRRPVVAPRLAPLEPPFEPSVQAQLERINPPGAPSILALFRLLASHPLLAERVKGWGSYFLGRTAMLPLRDRELVIDRVCARCGAEYEWGVHVAAFAEAAGFSPAQVASVAQPQPDLGSLTERDRLLVRLVDELHATSDVSDPLWAELAAVWTPAQLLELLMLAGWYRAIAYVCNATRLPPETWAARFPKEAA
jgi:4-carboxymuconolactone decarboxylase